MDLISRQAAIDAFYKFSSDGDFVNACEYVLRNVPSAEPEIIRCKECKICQTRQTANYLSFLYCDLNQHSVSENAFCAWAERRTDETD